MTATPLTEFLLARIAEDEETAKAEIAFAVDWPERSGGFGQITPARVLAECEAKRLIVEWDARQPVDYGVLIMLATVYADHPGHRGEWKL